MSACPFCQTPMRDAFSQGLSYEACDACDALWCEGESLTRLLGGTSPVALANEAKGRPGQCKGCRTELRYVPGCPSCGRQAPTCPHCGDAPLPVMRVRGVTVDLCPRCGGVGLDAGELEQLQEASGSRRYESLDLRPKVELGATPACTRCQRKLKPKYGFVWEERLYCASCAPEGSAPFTDELTKAIPSETPGMTREYEDVMNLSIGPAESVLAKLLSKLFG